MFQNHLLQILALVAMEPPASLEADRLRDEVSKVLSAIRPIDMFDTVCGQYEGYTDTKGVAEDSRTPTYAALRLNIDNWRWQGVPFYLRSGKALARKMTEVTVVFRDPPLAMFNNSSSNGKGRVHANALTICIQPDEGVHLTFEAKEPDSPREGRSVDMEFHYADTFGICAIPDAYERLILDALQGDAALFTRSDGIEAAWTLIDPIVNGWEAEDGPRLAPYARGSWGPAAADDLLNGDSGRAWRPGCIHEQSDD
jgi:glucose-6-phosphate 1-dehydrogenase